MDVVLSDKPTIKEIIECTYNNVSKYWKVSYNYTEVKPIYFGSKPLKKEYKLNVNFIKYSFYIHQIASYTLPISINIISYDEKLHNEILRVDEEGSYCIYASVLLYLLLGELAEKDCYLVQGFYRYNLREDFPSDLLPFSKIQMGFHAFLEYHGSIIDLCLYPQNMYHFDFKDKQMIMGIIPSGMQLVGFRETKDIVFEYAKDYAKAMNMTLDEWLDFHKRKADECLNKSLQYTKERK
jgi:hypothetical protein